MGRKMVSFDAASLNHSDGRHPDEIAARQASRQASVPRGKQSSTKQAHLVRYLGGPAIARCCVWSKANEEHQPLSPTCLFAWIRLHGGDAQIFSAFTIVPSTNHKCVAKIAWWQDAPASAFSTQHKQAGTFAPSDSPPHRFACGLDCRLCLDRGSFQQRCC